MQNYTELLIDNKKVIEIPLTKGMKAYVCTCHYDLVKNKKWHYAGYGYAARTLWDKLNKRSGGMQYLHRVIAGTPKGKSTDHIDGNKMNCTHWNLRAVDQNSNVFNSGVSRRSSTGYKGVSKMSNGRYRAYISDKRKQQHLGCYFSAEDAAIAYNVAAIEQWGPYALLNNVAKPQKK